MHANLKICISIHEFCYANFVTQTTTTEMILKIFSLNRLATKSQDFTPTSTALMEKGAEIFY